MRRIFVAILLSSVVLVLNAGIVSSQTQKGAATQVPDEQKQAEQQSALISNALGGEAPSIESYIASKTKSVAKSGEIEDPSSDELKQQDAENQARKISIIASQASAQSSCPNYSPNTKLSLSDGTYHIKVYNKDDSAASEYLSPMKLSGQKGKCVVRALLPQKFIHDEKCSTIYGTDGP